MFADSSHVVVASAEPDPCLELVPANAPGVFLCDFRDTNPSMKVLRSGQQAYTWDVLEAWGLTAGHALLTQLDKELRIKEDLLDLLDGRFALVLLTPTKGATEPEVLFVALIKDGDSAQKTLQRMVEATKKWKTKVFTKEYGGVPVTHIINKQQDIDLCYSMYQRSFAATDKMQNLQSWIDSRKQKVVSASPCAAALERFSEGIVRFYVKSTEVKGLRDKMPLPMTLTGAGKRPSLTIRKPEGKGEESSPGEEESSESGFPPEAVDSVVGSLMYEDTGVVMRVAAILKPTSEKESEGWRQLSKVRELYPDTLTFCPEKPIAVVAAPNLRSWVQVTGKDVDDAEVWSDMLGVEKEAAKEKVPASLKPLLSGDMAICLPELQAKQPPGGKPVRIEEVNPLDYAPLLFALRAPDDCDWQKTLPELRAFFRDAFKVKLQDENEVTAVFPPAEEGKGKPDKPVAYFTVTGHHLLISSDREQLTQAVQRTKEGKDSLSNNADFKEVASTAFQGSMAKLYFDPMKFLATGGEVALTAADMPNPYVRHAIELTFEGLRGMGLGVKVNETTVEGTYFLGADYEKLSDLKSLYAMAFPISAAVTFPVFSKARDKARQASCMSNLKQIGMSALMYSSDHNDVLPDVNRWRDQLMPYSKAEGLFRCPADEDSHPVSYAMNERLHLAKIPRVVGPGETVLFFDATGTSSNPHGSAGIIAKRHNNGLNACFVDGHVKWLKSIPASAWEPTKKKQ